MEENENSFSNQVLGVALAISIIGACVCGVLECLSVNTGFIGVFFGLVTILPIPIYLIYCGCFYILKKLDPGMSKNTATFIITLLLVGIAIEILCNI